MTTRRQQFDSALGSMRLEDAEPDPEVIAAGEAWVRGEMTAEDLDAAAKRAAAGLPPLSRPATAA
jgi:Antitoxin VbhA